MFISIERILLRSSVFERPNETSLLEDETPVPPFALTILLLRRSDIVLYDEDDEA